MKIFNDILLSSTHMIAKMASYPPAPGTPAHTTPYNNDNHDYDDDDNQK